MTRASAACEYRIGLASGESPHNHYPTAPYLLTLFRGVLRVRGCKKDVEIDNGENHVGHGEG